MDELTTKMGQTGQNATEQMAQKLSEAMAGMEARQQVINAELMKAVASVRNNVSESQAETSRKTQESIAAMSTSVTEVVHGMQTLIENASSRDEARTVALAQHANTTQEAMSANLEKTLGQAADVRESIRQAVQRMEQITTEALSRMNEGANTLYIAASDFAKAGTRTSETLDKANALVGQLSSASTALTGSSNTLTSAVSEYKTVRDEVARLVSELRATVEAAKTEATLTADVLARIEGATQKLIEAEHQADQYLDQISAVLAKAHGEFANNIVATLRQANTEFHQHLTTATKMLGQTIDELTDVLDRVPTR
jgi:chromosome segregation ATPase